MNKKLSLLSNTRLKFRLKRKSNPSIVDTIKVANENDSWKALAKVLSSGSRNYAAVNLKQIDEKTTAGDTILIPGKVLGSGDLTKKVKICALSISQSAVDKLKKTKSEYSSILDEIKNNKKAEGIKVIQ